MSDDALLGYILGTVVTFLIGTYFMSQAGEEYHIIKKTQWNCIQSRILDPKNVDKIECISYKKILKDEQ